ncbi:MAG: hypothetical protein ACE5JU_18815 [Candidatus Binatia bacterium]
MPWRARLSGPEMELLADPADLISDAEAFRAGTAGSLADKCRPLNWPIDLRIKPFFDIPEGFFQVIHF